MKEYQTYIFDLDGTLLNTIRDLAASVNYALRSTGMAERTLEEVREFVGNGVKKLMERACAQEDWTTHSLRQPMLPFASTTSTTVSTPRHPIRA